MSNNLFYYLLFPITLLILTMFLLGVAIGDHQANRKIERAGYCLPADEGQVSFQWIDQTGELHCDRQPMQDFLEWKGGKNGTAISNKRVTKQS